MADKAEPFKFTTNVPVPCEIRFVDIRPGKLWTDTKGVTKKLPAQVSVKGKFGSVDTICFLPGPAWKNVKCLAAGGVIEEGPALEAANDEELAQPFSAPVLHGKVTLTLAKPAGERYETLVVDDGKVAAQPAGRVASPYVKPSGPSIGAVPGMDDEGFPDEEYGRSVQSPDGVDPYLEPPKAPTPHRVPNVPPAVAPVAEQKAKVVRAYLDLFAWMRTQPEMKDVPLDVVQSASATIWIEWNKRQLVK